MEQQTHVLKLACPPIPVVRIGFVGLGNRGLATLQRYLVIDGVQISSLCDLRRSNLGKAQELLRSSGKPEAEEITGHDGWKKLCKQPDIDLIYICTDWLTHTAIATYAMQQGKHVAIEVPAAMSIEECWQLVDTAETTHRHCFMLENCCYDTFALSTLQMHREGMFGDLTHCEGAYIHDLRDRYTADENNGGFHEGWIAKFCGKHAGNPYPTHGLGPVCQLLGIHRGDRLDYLVSLSPDIRTSSSKESGIYINNTLIRTVKGKSILIQYDVTTPRPYSRLQTVCGTRGFIQKYPVQCLMLDGQEAVTGEQLGHLLEHYRHPFEQTYGSDAERLHVPNVMNYMMDRRLIHCLQQGLPLDMDVYDAAEWSCITELSEQSVRGGSIPVKIPDFTRGRWDVLSTHHLMED